MRTIVFCRRYPPTTVIDSIALSGKVQTVDTLETLREELKQSGDKHVVLALDKFEQAMADLIAGLARVGLEVTVLSFDRKTIESYSSYCPHTVLLGGAEPGMVYYAGLKKGKKRLTTDKQLFRISLSNPFGAARYRFLNEILKAARYGLVKQEDVFVQKASAGVHRKNLKREAKISFERETPVPVVENAKDGQTPPSLDLAKATAVLGAFFKGDTKTRSSLSKNSVVLDMSKVEREEPGLDDMFFQINTDKFDYRVYQTPMEFLVNTGVITAAAVQKLTETQEQIAREKGLKLALEDLTILTKAASEDAVIEAMRSVYHMDFLSYRRLCQMKLITNVFPREVCKKYSFVHVHEEPRVLVSTQDNKLVQNLGVHFGDARIVYSLKSIILARINSVSEEDWEHEGSSIS